VYYLRIENERRGGDNQDTQIQAQSSPCQETGKITTTTTYVLGMKSGVALLSSCKDVEDGEFTFLRVLVIPLTSLGFLRQFS